MVNYSSMCCKKQNEIISKINFTGFIYIRPPSTPNRTKLKYPKWAVMKGLYRFDQKNNFFYFGSLEGRIGHYNVVWTYFNIFHISTISLSLLMASGWGHRNPSSSLLHITLPFRFSSLYFDDLGIIWCRNELCMYKKQFCCSNLSSLCQTIKYLTKFQEI